MEDHNPSYDSSTPEQYDALNSGLLFFTNDEKGETSGAVLTTKARDRYNDLIKAYGLQLYEAERVHLVPDSGISYFKDIYGNNLFKIDPQHLAYFLKMNRWSREGRKEDTLWMKAKDIL